MARPLKQNLDWFQHDCKASSDEKMEIFETKYPNGTGYSWYFKTLERIYFHCGKLDVSEAETIQILSRNLSVNPKEIIEFAVKIGLFDKTSYENDRILTSKRILDNIKPVLFKREKMAKLYQDQVSEAETPQKPVVPEADISSRVEIEYIKDIIDFLNISAKTEFRYQSKGTQRHISARLKEGFTVEQFKTVIIKKCEDWLNDIKMKEYLRPETLFGTKFESYLQSATAQQANKPKRIIQ